jgi:hypothetical protein
VNNPSGDHGQDCRIRHDLHVNPDNRVNPVKCFPKPNFSGIFLPGQAASRLGRQ